MGDNRRALFDGLTAAAAAVAALTVAALASSPAVIAAACAVAFAAAVQQYAVLVAAHIAARTHRGIPVAGVAAVGLGAFAATRSPAVLAAVASACLVACVWSVIVLGVAVAGRDVDEVRRLPGLAGRARWQRLGDGLAASRDVAFWGLVVARPIARVVLQLVAEVRWITPNRITIVSIATCALASAAIVRGADALAIALIGVRSVLDSLDGQLARYRACSTLLGSYVDKVSDMFCWAALFGALGVRAYDGATALLLLPLVAANVNALAGLALWLARTLSPASAGAASPAGLGFRAWAGSLWRIVLFEEPDFYLWIALAVATRRFDIFVPFIACAYVGRALVLAIARTGIARAVWRKESPA